MIKKQAEGIIEIFEHMRKLPELYVGTHLDNIVPYLNGVVMILHVIEGFEQYQQELNKTIVDRGWRLTASITAEMREQGLNEKEIAVELIDIHLDTLRAKVLSI